MSDATEALDLQQAVKKTQAQQARRRQQLLDPEATTKALISACYAGDLERVVALLGDGANPSATDVVGWFPLYQAACGGDSHSEDHAKVIATLIDHGVHLCGNQPVRRVHDNSSLSHFSAMKRPSWLGRAVRNRHRHAIEQASRRWRERAVKF